MATEHIRNIKRLAGLASGVARRERVRERDLLMALERTRFPGRSYARLGAPYGLSRDGARKAVRRALANPDNRAAIQAAQDERSQSSRDLDAALRKA